MVTNAATLDLLNLAKDLQTAGEQIGTATDRVLSDAAKYILVEMQMRTPVRTGNLKASETIQAMPGRYVVGPVGVPYAWFVEFGTSRMQAQPYIRPAVQMYLDKLGAQVADVGVSMVMGKQS